MRAYENSKSGLQRDPWGKALKAPVTGGVQLAPFDGGYMACRLSSGHSAIKSMVVGSTMPRRNRSHPAQAIIAPLSVQSLGGGHSRGTP